MAGSPRARLVSFSPRGNQTLSSRLSSPADGTFRFMPLPFASLTFTVAMSFHKAHDAYTPYSPYSPSRLRSPDRTTSSLIPPAVRAPRQNGISSASELTEAAQSCPSEAGHCSTPRAVPQRSGDAKASFSSHSVRVLCWGWFRSADYGLSGTISPDVGDITPSGTS